MKILSILLVLFLGSFAVNAQTMNTEEAHAALIYNISKYVEWSNVDGSFDIVVINQPALFEQLKKYYTNKVIAGKGVTLSLDKTNRTDFTGYEIVISNNKKIFGDNILTINTSSTNGIANFVNVNDKVKIKVNKNLAESSKLKIANSLLSIVEIIE
jgi:hypothetical protein